MTNKSTYEFVVRDPSAITKHERELQVIRDVLESLDQAIAQLASGEETQLQLAVSSVADFLQSFTAQTLGVDIRATNSTERLSAQPLELCATALQQHCQNGQDGLWLSPEREREVRNLLQTTMTLIHTYKDELQKSESSGEFDSTLRALQREILTIAVFCY